MMVIARKRFSENVGEILCGSNMFDRNSPRFNKVADIVVFDINMFHFAVVSSILCQCNSTSVITFNEARKGIFNVNFL